MGIECTLGNYETINNASDILRKQIRHAEKAYLFQESDGQGKNPDAVPMTSSPAAAAPVWFLYKLFSDLGIYYYFAGEKRARERSEILVCIPGGEGSVGREGRMKGPTTRGSSLIVYVMWKNDLSPRCSGGVGFCPH